jgi:hypothetical protein
MSAVASLFGAPPKNAPARPRLIRVPVTLSTPEPVLPGQFTASFDNGADARVMRVRSPQDDLLLLVVLDLVADLSVVDPARDALATVFRELPANTHIGLLRAQDGLQVLQDPTPNRDLLAESLRTMPVSGRAGLLDTVEAAAQLADSIAAKSTVRVAILYVTDSDVRNYRQDFTNPVINSSDSRDLSRRFPEGLIREKISKTVDSLAAFESPVFIVHVKYSSERLNEAYQSGLMQIASATGADALFCRSTTEIPEAVAGSVKAAQNQYSLVVQMPPKAPKVVQLLVTFDDKPVNRRSRWVLK